MNNCHTSCGCHWKPLALGLALGTVWGFCILLMGLILHFALFDNIFITNMGTIYVGDAPTIMSAILGALLAFAHGFIKGIIIAWLYNVFAGCCKGCGYGDKRAENVETIVK